MTVCPTLVAASRYSESGRRLRIRLRFIWVLFAVLVIAAPTGCTKSNTGKDEVQFTVDRADLGERFQTESDGFTLWVPSNWQAPPDSLYDVARQLVQDAIRRDPRRTPELLALYREPQYGSHLAVARYSAELRESELDSLIAWHQARLGEDPASQVYPTQFTYSGYHVRQIMLVGPDAVTIKLFTRHKNQHVYQIDYRVPRAAYVSEQPRIESSMGSLGRRELN